MPEETLAYNVAQAIQGEGHWRDLDLYVHCIVATKDSCLSIQKEREEAQASYEDVAKIRSQLEEECRVMQINVHRSKELIEKESSRVQTEFLDYRAQMLELT